MNDIWSIIGISSLVASVVTVILGIVRDVLVEKYRFKRESEAGYVQRQIEIYSRIYFLVNRLAHGPSALRELFGEWEDNVKEINEIIKTQASMLEPKALNEWLAIWGGYEKFKKAEAEKQEEIVRKILDHIKQLVSIIKDRMNNNLIPKYRKIVGETVPLLE